MTKDADHALTEATERVRLTGQNLASIEHDIARLDAPATRTVKVKIGRRETDSIRANSERSQSPHCHGSSCYPTWQPLPSRISYRRAWNMSW